MKEYVYNLEELHRGKWQPLVLENGKQKFAKITEDEADIMNGQTVYSNIRYVKDGSKKEESKKTEAKKEETDMDALKKEYEEVVGKKPHHNSGEEKLLEDIANAKK